MARVQIVAPTLIFGFLTSFLDAPANLNRLVRYTLVAFILLMFVLGALFTIFGLIFWITDKDTNRGKKAMVKGIVFICLSLLLYFLSSFLFDFLNVL